MSKSPPPHVPGAFPSAAAAEVAFWRSEVQRALREVPTPCFVFAAEPLVRQVNALQAAFEGLPVRHWWSFKTLPLRRALQAWRRLGRPVEVVSEFELRMAVDLGFEPADILVNGPAKHTWLKRWPLRGLRVNFDSVAELAELARVAKGAAWQVGVRVSLSAEDNFEYPGIRAQFGLLGDEIPAAAKLLRRADLAVGVVHFHLRTNVPEPRCYAEAIDDALSRAGAAGWCPAVLDIGGGFPPSRVATRRGARVDASFSLAAMRAVLANAIRRHSLREVWLENGRWLTAPTAVLAVRVLDVKENRGARVLICDGGRTLQAMVATWERHAVTTLARRSGRRVATILHGPTCMAFDNLGVHDLPATVRAGDVLLWFDAGAYQTAWETRFSHGLAAITWSEGGQVDVVRGAEPFEAWRETR